MHITLNVTAGPHKGDQFAFDKYETFMIGRGQTVQFRIADDPYFSRYHCMIEVCPPHCFLRDVGSTNGTYVNRKRIRQVRLKDGDVIRGGRTRMQVQIREDASGNAPSEPIASPETAPGGFESPLKGDWMDTLPIVGGLYPLEPGHVRCSRCGRVPEETELPRLTDAQMISYVCPTCRKEIADALHPIPNYEVLGVLGRGSLGPVYKARRVSSDRLTALKLAPPEIAGNEKVVQMFVRQMRLCAKLEHENIVPIVEVGQAGQQLWIATEYVEGVDAADLARRHGGRLPLRDAADIVCQALAGLEYAHGRNLVHRDVKPPNILVSRGRGPCVARLSDLGLVKNMDEAGVSQLTLGAEKRGTVTFMPPEQVLDPSQVKPPSDIYAVGATLYWLVTGQFAHDFEARDRRGEVKDPFSIICEDPIIPIRKRDPSVPEDVAQVVEKALRHDPEDRFEAACEMARALRKASTSMR